MSRADAVERGAVLQLLARANEQYRTALPAAAFDRYLAAVLDLESRDAVASLLVVRIDGRTVGTVTFFPDARGAGWSGRERASGLRAMGVDPACRLQGVGTALVTACIDRARRAGVRSLTLHTAEWLRDAVRLYQRCGFIREPARDRSASDLIGVPREHDFAALAYRLDLGS